MSELFTPITLRELTVRNRVWVAPMCQYSATDGVPDDWHLVHLGSFARGGAGLVMTEASAVTPEGRISPADAGIWNDEQATAWRRITDFIHGQGAVAAIQLAHAGRKASSNPPWVGGYTADADGGWTPLGPSAEAFPGLREPAEMTRAHIVDVVALASGDPLVSGIGTTLIDLLGADQVRIEPAVSSVALARARMGWAAETTTVLTLVGRDPYAVLRQLADGHRVLVLSSDETTPATVAALLVGAGFGGSRTTVLGDLGAATESRRTTTAEDWLSHPPAQVPRLHVLALELAGPPGHGWTAGLPDDAYEHDGQLTKRDLRASALARLAPTPGDHLWDVGAGAGSVGIEWMRAHPTCTATAVEADPDRAARIGRNARTLGVPALEVVRGKAPDALTGLDRPDAVFVGGGATREGVLDACLAALRPGGRLVVHGVTLETEQTIAETYRRHGGELTRIAVETSAAIGTFTGWTPARTVTQWVYERSRDGS